MHRQVQDAVYGGAELLAGGEPLPGRGFFYPPTVLVNAPDDALVNCGETRGPVVTVRVADSFDDGAGHAAASGWPASSPRRTPTPSAPGARCRPAR